jgi:hypothetical protein
MSVPSQLAALLDRRLEVGFVRPPVNDPAIGTEVLIREPLVAALPRNRRLASKGRVSLSTLVDEPFVLVQRENGDEKPRRRPRALPPIAAQLLAGLLAGELLVDDVCEVRSNTPWSLPVTSVASGRCRECARAQSW